MNSGYERSSNANITKQLHFVKYPLPMVESVKSSTEGTFSNGVDFDPKEEMKRLNLAVDSKRIECTNVKFTQRERKACDNELGELRNQIKILENDPSNYAAYKQQLATRELAEKSKINSRKRDYTIYDNENSKIQPQIGGPIVRLGNGNAINTGTGEG